MCGSVGHQQLQWLHVKAYKFLSAPIQGLEPLTLYTMLATPLNLKGRITNHANEEWLIMTLNESTLNS